MRNGHLVPIMAILLLLPSFCMVFMDHADALDHGMDSPLSGATASFLGEDQDDYSAWSVSMAGDVNGDGYDDIIIGAKFNDEYDSYAGQAYVVFGRSSGWSLDQDLGAVNASYRGEANMDFAGTAVAGAGDVNGDGYADLLIGAPENDENGSASGQVYLIMGMKDGWKMDFNLSQVGFSFLGEGDDDKLGSAVAGAGDVNGDGYADILIGAPRNGEGGFFAGQTYLILGRASGWQRDANMSFANASFLDTVQSWCGSSVAGAGDVNGDGYDDILIGSPENDNTGGINGGAAFVVFGKATGWEMDTNLSEADASYFGEEMVENAASSVAGAGDIDGDGYDDILIGAHGFGNHKGKVYLIYGKANGWPSGLNLTQADAAFVGEFSDDNAGRSVSGAGDVNGDGYDDFIVGAYKNDEGGTFSGQTHLILGSPTRYSGNTSLSTVNASFIGEGINDLSGWSVSGGDDLDGDGHDDIIIGARGRENGIGQNAGETYAVMPDANAWPSSVTSMKAFLDHAHTQEVLSDPVLLHQAIYVELVGTDGDPAGRDTAIAHVTSSLTSPIGIQLRLYETGDNTGVYRGNFTVSDRTHEDKRLLGTGFAEDVIVASVQDPSVNVTFSVVDPPKIWPVDDVTVAQEDAEYSVHYWSEGDPVTDWIFETNASWLEWNATTHDLTGVPANHDVGQHRVRVNITNGVGYFDEHDFTITVNNTPPEILTDDTVATVQGQAYSVDYNSSDDGQGNITWHLVTNATWLTINDTTGLLNGTASNDDVGWYVVNVSVHDGNGGWDQTLFNLTVANKNDPPTILTLDVTVVMEDEPYNVTYVAEDMDVGDNVFWSFSSNASWLEMDQETGRVHGTPGNEDVGDHWVNVTITDSHKAADSHNFSLTVVNVNDPPVISSQPVLEAMVFYEYTYDVEAYDIDTFDTLEFGLETSPENMSMDEGSGAITWRPTKEQEWSNNVVVRVTDGNATTFQDFDVTVTVPQVTLTSPEKGGTVDTLTPELHWRFSQTDLPDLRFDVYLGTETPPRTLLKGDHNSTDLRIGTPLTDNMTYHWMVVPKSGGLTGEPSPVWDLHVRTPILPVVKLDLDRNNLEVHRGDTITVNMTIANDGNVDGVVTITIETLLDEGIFEFDDTVHLGQGDSTTVQLVIDIPKDCKFNIYGVTMTASLLNATSSEVLTISVVKRSEPTTVNLWEDPLFWGILIMIIGLAVGGVLFISHKRRRSEERLKEALIDATTVEDFNIDEIFLVYNDGRLIDYVSNKASKTDKQLFTGMLVAIGNFVKESFEGESGLKSFEFGQRKIVLEKGRHLILVVALSGTEPKVLKGHMHGLVEKLEGLYAGMVEQWDGNLAVFKDVKYNLSPLFYIKEGLKIKKEKESVRILSGIEFFSGFVRLKVAVKNDLSIGINDIAVGLNYDERLLHLSHIEPDYPLKGTTVTIDSVGKGEKRTVAFYLDPLICQESNVDCKVTFIDDFGMPGEVAMKTRPVSIACPIFYTPETVNVAMLKRLLDKLRYDDTKIYRISGEVDIHRMYELAKKAVQRHDIKFVREYSEYEPFSNEGWYYGSSSETDEEIVIRVTVRDDTRTLEIFVASGNLSTMTGLLAELGHTMNQLVAEMGLEVMKPSTDHGLREYLEKKPKLIDKVLTSEVEPQDDDI